MQQALEMHRTMPAVAARDVRIGFLGEGKLEHVVSEAISTGMPQAWHAGRSAIFSVVRQVCGAHEAGAPAAAASFLVC